MTRRSALIIVALMATASVVLAACGAGTPAAPPLTDPKEILSKSVLSLKDVKTFEMTGTFTGTLTVPEMGALDLSTSTMSAAMDIPGRKAKFVLDAPSVLGTKLDAILIDTVAYYKVSGLMAGMLGVPADKFTKVDVPPAPSPSASSVTDAQAAEAIEALNKELDKLPPPTKGADEKCGDQDCYHVTLAATAEDLKKMDPTGMVSDGSFSLDVWTRKNDLRPAKVALSVTTAETGTVGITLEFKYDVTVSVEAPPADQIAP